MENRLFLLLYGIDHDAMYDSRGDVLEVNPDDWELVRQEIDREFLKEISPCPVHPAYRANGRYKPRSKKPGCQCLRVWMAVQALKLDARLALTPPLEGDHE